MKVTIDSNEYLTDVLRVIGRMYDVTLATADHSADSRHKAAAAPRGSKLERPTKTTVTTSGRKRGRTDRTGDDPKLVREWARENGLDVSTRGACPGLPDTVGVLIMPR